MGQACFRCWRCDNQPGLRAATKQAGPILAESGGESSSPAENRGWRGVRKARLPRRARSGCLWKTGPRELAPGDSRSPSSAKRGHPECLRLVGDRRGCRVCVPPRHGQALRREPRAKAGAQDTNSGPVCSKLLLGPQWLCRRTNASPEATVLWGCHSCLTFCRHRLPLCDSPVCTKQGVNLVVVAGALLI